MESPEKTTVLGQTDGNSASPWLDRVYLADDHPFFATALASLINNEADLSVCGSSADRIQIITEVNNAKPDILVMDVNLSARANWQLAVDLRRWSQSVPLLFVSSLQNPKVEAGMKWLEPCSFVEKTKDPTDIVKAIRQTLRVFRQNRSPRADTLDFYSREIQRP
jgi:DNA-binding NarL/FixJ family response regulator